VKNGDTYEVRPSGYDWSDSRIGVDLDLTVPKTSPLTVKTDKGDIQISDMAADIGVTDQIGDVEVRNVTGDLLIDMHKGDLKVSDNKGDVKVSGKGGEIDVINATGSLTVDGDFYGPVRADKVSKGVRIWKQVPAISKLWTCPETSICARGTSRSAWKIPAAK